MKNNGKGDKPMTFEQFLAELAARIVYLEDQQGAPSALGHFKQLIKRCDPSDPKTNLVRLFMYEYHKAVEKMAYNDEFSQVINGVFTPEELKRLRGE